MLGFPDSPPRLARKILNAGLNSNPAQMELLLERARQREINLKDVINLTKSFYGETTLLCALRRGYNASVVKALLDAGADPNLPGTYQDAYYTSNLPIFECWGSPAESLALLLKAGADPNVVTSSSPSLLFTILSKSNTPHKDAYKKVALLLDYGAKLGVANKDGDTPLHICVLDTLPPELRDRLIKAAPDINARNKDSETPLMRALSIKSSAATLKALIAAGSDLTARNKDGFDPLMYAVYFGYAADTIDILTAAGANPNARHAGGESVLIQAARKEMAKGDLEGFARRLQHLIRAGADPWATFDQQITVLNVLELRQDLQPEDKLAVARIIVPEMFDPKLWKGKTEGDALEAWARVPRTWRETGEAPIAALIRQLRSEAGALAPAAVQVPVRARGSNPGALA